MKSEKKTCPQCGKEKVFANRNKYCSPQCSQAAQGKEDVKIGTSEIKGDIWAISIPKTRIHTLEQLVDFFSVDLETWEVERFVVNAWEMGRKDKQTHLTFDEGVINGSIDDSGEINVEPLFQVKAFLKRRVLRLAILDEIESLKEYAKKKKNIFPIIKGPDKKSGYMLEIGIPDLHLGKLAWSKQTGWEDYDVKIAERLHDVALETLIERTKSFPFDEISFVVGNDLLQTDNLNDTTTAGTSVSSDSRFHKTFRIAREMNTRAIERLRKIAPVKVWVVPGNHDNLSAWMLGDSLECYFHGCKDVIVENDPTPRKYYQWGNVMLMWTHKAQKSKRDDYPLLMATERPDIFGKTIYREVHTGDLHQVRLEETHGIRVRILPSLSSADDWHSDNGFVGNIRSAEAYVWSKTEGLVGTAVFVDPNHMPKKMIK